MNTKRVWCDRIDVFVSDSEKIISHLKSKYAPHERTFHDKCHFKR